MNGSAQPSLNKIVEHFDGRLTESDRAILSVLLNSPKSAVFLSVAQLAEKADVHKSTVVRLAHKLGFDGYPELRVQIRSEVHPEASSEKRSQQRMESIEQGSNLNALIESEIAALNAISNSLSQAQIDIAAEHLSKQALFTSLAVAAPVPWCCILTAACVGSAFRRTSPLISSGGTWRKNLWR